jgi:sugar phosphate isomerase/epimerase
MADLGFEHVELSHGIRISLVPGILKAFEEKVVKVGSTHNICPLPPGITQAAPNIYQPSSVDWREREQWVRHTKRSLDFAAQMQSRVLVCHLGSVAFLWFNPAKKIDAYLRRKPLLGAPSEDRDYQEMLAASLAKLRRQMGSYWEHTKACVNEVFGYAGEKGIKLGFENREAFDELPLDADFPAFLAGFPAAASVGYWHDVGHAQIKAGLGLIDHRQQLEANASRLLGFHLHDVNLAGDDHQPIGSGCVDFAMVREFWRPEHLLVLEINPRATVEEVLDSKKRLEALIG